MPVKLKEKHLKSISFLQNYEEVTWLPYDVNIELAINYKVKLPQNHKYCNFVNN